MFNGDEWTTKKKRKLRTDDLEDILSLVLIMMEVLGGQNLAKNWI